MMSNSDARKRQLEQVALCPCDQPNCSDAGLREDVILATPDWLAERDARIRRETAEQIAQAIDAYARGVKALASQNRGLYDTGGYLARASAIARQSAERGGER